MNNGIETMARNIFNEEFLFVPVSCINSTLKCQARANAWTRNRKCQLSTANEFPRLYFAGGSTLNAVNESRYRAKISICSHHQYDTLRSLLSLYYVSRCENFLPFIYMVIIPIDLNK